MGRNDNFSTYEQLVENKLLQFHLNDLDQTLLQVDAPFIRHFYQFHKWTYQFVGSQSPAYLDTIKRIWDPTLSLIKAQPDTNPLKEVMLAEIYGKRALIEFIEKDYLTAVWYLRSCKSHINKQEKRFPERIEQKKILGLFNVLFGAVPKKYQWITQMLGFQGDIQEGITQLRQAAHTSQLLRLENTLFYYYATKNLIHQPQEAIQHLKRLQQNTPPSIILDYCLITGYIGLKMNEQAIQLLAYRDRYANNPKVFFIPLWDYYMGKSYYYKSAYSQAQTYFNRFLLNHEGNLYVTDAMFRMGMSYILANNYPAGKRHLQLLLQRPTSDLEEDQYAYHLSQTFISQPPPQTTRILFTARNAYDGGYYDRALSLLNELPTPLNTEDQTFYYYLKGRIYHTIGESAQADSYYASCIQQPEAKNTKWQQAYACFYKANLAEARADVPQAKSFYQKALNYDEYFYQASLENQCKVAMGRLN